MAAIDRSKFAYAVAGVLHKIGVSGPRSAQARFPAVKASTWTRIGNGHRLSDDNFAAVCKVLSLNAADYVDLEARNPMNIPAHFAGPGWTSKAGRKPAHQEAVA